MRPEWNTIMNTDVEDMLREGMERFTRDLRAPEGLTVEAERRRRRRLALRSVTSGAAALMAGAAALTAVVVAGGRPDGTGHSVVLAAYVVKRVDRALSAAEPGEIAQMTVTRTAQITGGKTVTTTAEEWSYGNQWRAVTNSATAHPVYDEGFSSASMYTLVGYLTRMWASEPGLGRPAASAFGAAPIPVLGLSPALLFGPTSTPAFAVRAASLFGLRACKPVVAGVPALFQPGLPGIGFTAPPGLAFSASALPTARALRAAISCGALTEAGRQLVDGVEAIKLTSRAKSPISETIWVSPGTYLPVRVIVSSALGFARIRQTADITWLPPTSQNLAKLTVPIPAGFRKVSIAQAVVPILGQLQRGLAAGPRFLCPTGPAAQGGNNCIRFEPGAS
jgi:hypothetical protein